MFAAAGSGLQGGGWADGLCVGCQAELQRVSHQLRQSTKQLCRNLKDNPNVAENMAKVSAIRQSLSSLLLQCLSEVEVDGNVKAMVETVMAQERHEVFGCTGSMSVFIADKSAEKEEGCIVNYSCVGILCWPLRNLHWFRWK